MRYLLERPFDSIDNGLWYDLWLDWPDKRKHSLSTFFFYTQ